ncbi:MAG TPA: DUF3592 domain-containing protein [Candidatus Angelobacter sp.]|nr:DUF3592 domain-containing protein [Candidatus Angelobacter sp.]
MIWMGSILAIVGLLISGIAVLAYRRDQAALAWPTARGKVLASSVKEVSGDSITYKPDIQYEYNVNRSRHSAKVWRFGAPLSSSKSKIEEIVSQYPVGKDIEVFFNPQDPTDAILEPGETKWRGKCVVGLLMAFIGMGVACVGISIYLKDQRAQSWPTTTGQIVYSAVFQGQDSDGNTTYTPQIQYSYQVNDHQYIGAVWRFGADNVSRMAANQAVATYQPGKSVTVFFNPEDPKETVLEPGMMQTGLPIIFVSLCVAGIVGLYAYRRSHAAQRFVRHALSPALRTPAN